jgi:hypothetical protein
MLLAAFLAGGSTQCLLYTDPINEDPEVTISPERSTFMRNERAQFSARARDPDQQAATIGLAWFERNGAACPTTVAEAMVDPSLHVGDGATIELGHAAAGAYCLWVIATDREGAKALATRPLMVANQAPVGALAIEGPTEARAINPTNAQAREPIDVALFSEVRLSAAGSMDPEGDPLTYTWHITRPDGSAAEPQPCTQAADARIVSCYVVVAPGLHRFELDVSDGSAPGAPVVLPVMALPDAAPCVVSTTPPFLLPTISRNGSERLLLQVGEVTDDGDPFPARAGQASQSSFTWYSRKLPATTFERWASRLSFLEVPPSYASAGEVVEFRLQYGDRVKDRALACDANALACPASVDDKCHQWVGWTVTFR